MAYTQKFTLNRKTFLKQFIHFYFYRIVSDNYFISHFIVFYDFQIFKK